MIQDVFIVGYVISIALISIIQLIVYLFVSANEIINSE